MPPQGEEEAEQYANQLLGMAKDRQRNWNTGNAIHVGNLVLGRLALQSGDIEDSKSHLLKAGGVSASPQLKSFGPNMTLANELLERGEKDVVVKYLQLCKKFWASDKLDRGIALIQVDQLPDFGANLYWPIRITSNVYGRPLILWNQTRGHSMNKSRVFNSGGFFFLAVLCGLAFIGAGRLEGDRQLMWKVGSAALGGVSLVAALYMAWKKQ